MAIFSEGGVTSPDIYIGVSCITVTVICTVLNFLVFLHNYHKRSSVARNLFLFLSAADLLTVWIILVPYSVHAFKDKDEECRDSIKKSCNEEYYKSYREADFWDKVLSVMSSSTIPGSTTITAFMTITRYFQIKDPLRPLKSKIIYAALFLSIAWGPLLLACSYLNIDAEINKLFSHNLQKVFLLAEKPQLFGQQLTWTNFLILVTSATFALQICATTLSFMTIYELFKSFIKPVAGGRPNRNVRTTLRILIMNFGSCLYLVGTMIFCSTDYDNGLASQALEKDIVTLLAGTVVPAVLSTINPVIYILFAGGFSITFTIKPQRN